MELEFFGAAGEVTGSCHILRIGTSTILLDCGLIQGSRRDEERNRDRFPFAPAAVDAVLLSHAHLDHSGRLPLLVKRGFRGPVYAHEATCELAAILLADAARLEERDAEYLSHRTGKRIKPLFTFDEGQRVLRQMRGMNYRRWFRVADGVQARFRDAGHILGSCAVEIQMEETGRRMVFSGDLGQYDTPILHDPECITKADLAVMESTYGNRRHRDRDATLAEMGEIIATAAADRGNILIPAFAVGRSQEILYQLGKHHRAWGLDRFQVFLDSPMAIEASRVYWHYHRLYDEEATRLRENRGGMPLLPALRMTSATEESMAINRIRSGAIIIAGSGMCNGGRIVHHLRHNLPRDNNHVIIVGYQARGSLGRRLVDGQDRVRIHGQTVPVRARVHTVGGLSAHGDREDLARWYECMAGRPPLYLVHGEAESQVDLAGLIARRTGARPHLAKPGEKVSLAQI